MEHNPNQYNDKYLLKLVLIAQNSPVSSKARNLALNKLCIAIPDKLSRPSASKFCSYFIYLEIIEEALANTLFYICKNIDKYHPKKATVMGWVQFYFTNRIKDVIRKKRLETQRIVLISNDSNEDFIYDHPDPNSQSPSLVQEIRQILLDDPENYFKNTHIRGNPDANFQSIALFYLDGLKWEEIAEKFNSKISTLSSFYERKLTEFAPKIKQYIQQ